MAGRAGTPRGAPARRRPGSRYQQVSSGTISTTPSACSANALLTEPSRSTAGNLRPCRPRTSSRAPAAARRSPVTGSPPYTARFTANRGVPCEQRLDLLGQCFQRCGHRGEVRLEETVVEPEVAAGMAAVDLDHHQRRVVQLSVGEPGAQRGRRRGGPVGADDNVTGERATSDCRANDDDRAWRLCGEPGGHRVVQRVAAVVAADDE